MKSLVLAFLLASIAHALPQAPPPGSAAAAGPTPSSPKVIGQLPKDGLKALPFPYFDQLASLLGFDPSKATADGNG